MTTSSTAVDLHWIPLGAGGHSVRLNGRVYEAIEARREHREPLDIYHAVLVVQVDGTTYAVELAPSPDAHETSRGVVATGAVGDRHLSRFRLFRYEVRCWPGGSIPDLDHAVGPPQRLSEEPAVARAVLDAIARAPHPVWGRDELHAGEMWNSNSMVAWSLETAGISIDDVRTPPHGRAPGWSAGAVVARRGAQPRRSRRANPLTPSATAPPATMVGPATATPTPMNMSGP